VQLFEQVVKAGLDGLRLGTGLECLMLRTTLDELRLRRFGLFEVENRIGRFEVGKDWTV
jgi:hypothetical protein